jgi:hypothetical protein
MENTLLYNGLTIAQVANNLPPDMTEEHKELYLNNCRFVVQNEYFGTNLKYCQFVRNSNFNLINFYNNLNS